MYKSDYMIKDIVFGHKELFKTICSTHYPFTKDELRKYWDKLAKGDAYYSFYIGDTEEFYTPSYGLCWNSNVEWDDWLKSHWYYYNPNSDQIQPSANEDAMRIGFWNPFDGSMFDNANKVPLDIRRAGGGPILDEVAYDLMDGRVTIEELEQYYSKDYLEELEETIDYVKRVFHRKYGKLSPKTISSYLTGEDAYGYKEVMIIDRDLWDKTLSRWIDADIIKELFS